jgi:acetyltransferase-like isoleucine patch superfamily enzyme
MRSVAIKMLHQLAYSIKVGLPSAIRARLSGAEYFGKGPEITGKVLFELSGTATFGDRFRAEGKVSPVSILVVPSASLTVGSDVYLNTGISIEAWHDVKIGNNVLMGPFVSIIDDDRHLVEPGSIRYKGPTVVGNNVWLGRGVSVMPGVRIGDGSVVAAHAVVTRDIPPNSFAGGVPARVLRKLDLPDGWVRHGVPLADQPVDRS